MGWPQRLISESKSPGSGQISGKIGGHLSLRSVGMSDLPPASPSPQPSVLAERIYTEADAEFRYILELKIWQRRAAAPITLPPAADPEDPAAPEDPSLLGEPLWLQVPDLEVLYFVQTQLNAALNPLGGYSLGYLRQVYELLKLHYWCPG